MILEDILNSANPEIIAKAYSKFLFEIVNGSDVKLLRPFSNEHLVRFINAVFEELKPHLN